MGPMGPMGLMGLIGLMGRVKAHPIKRPKGANPIYPIQSYNRLRLDKARS